MSSPTPALARSPLAIDLAGIPLRNPVLLAAGTAGTLTEMADVLDLSKVGGVVTKSITVAPREGNKTWRIIPSDHGMLNAIGLANVGVEAFARDYASQVAAVPTAVVGSVSEFSIEGYVRVAAMFDATPGIVAVELNVSCPNVNHGCEFGSDPSLLAELVRAVRAVTPRVRLFVQLSPVVM
ncbi:MAG: dihydroorotate dehydrogenase, partial [Phycisphaerae bacterium]